MTEPVWGQGEAYERFMGRWSVQVADEFLAWLDVEPGLRWLDVGCGTGALSSRILERSAPAWLAGVDPSPAFVETARARLGPDADVRVGDAQALPFADDAFDVAVSGLVLNFVPDPAKAVAEQARAATRLVAAYVWDYAEGMDMLRIFWEEATALDPASAGLDEGERFPLAREHRLQALFADAGLRGVRSRALEVPASFTDFDDLWNPFLGGQGPAGALVVSLDEARREELRRRLRDRLRPSGNEPIELRLRAWAVSGGIPG